MRGKHLRGLRDPNTHDIITVKIQLCVCLCEHCVGGDCSRNMAYGRVYMIGNKAVKVM